MKCFVKILICTAMPLLIVCALIASIALVSGDSSWYRREYEKLDIGGETGMSIDDMHSSIMLMVDYMKGGNNMAIRVTVNGVETDMFNETEISHMADVQRLYTSVRLAGILIFIYICAAIGLSFLVFKKAALKRLCRAYIISLCAFIAIIAAITIWLAVDFDSFWKVFHIIFLDLESSTFDPRYSRMIQICPAKLFEDMIIRIISYASAVLLTHGAGSVFYLIISRNGKKIKNEL